jgi:hypothetical protein
MPLRFKEIIQFSMKTVMLTLPDSVPFTEAQIRALVMEKAAETTDSDSRNELSALLGRSVSAEEVADIRHLIGLYYAERATRLVDAQWEKNGWTADTMHEWLQKHMRTGHGRPVA